MERFKSEALYLCGVDIDDYALFRARSLNIYDGLIRCDVRFLPFRSDAFDIVLCREVIEHLEKVEAFKVMEELERVASRQVIITTPYGYLPMPSHRSGWAQRDFLERGYVSLPQVSRYPVVKESESVPRVLVRFFLTFSL